MVPRRWRHGEMEVTIVPREDVGLGIRTGGCVERVEEKWMPSPADAAAQRGLDSENLRVQHRALRLPRPLPAPASRGSRRLVLFGRRWTLPGTGVSGEPGPLRAYTTYDVCIVPFGDFGSPSLLLRMFSFGWRCLLIKRRGVSFSWPLFSPRLSALLARDEAQDVNMGADAVNASAALPELPQALSSHGHGTHGALLALLSSYSIWQYVVTLVLGVLVYDQGEQSCVMSEL